MEHSVRLSVPNVLEMERYIGVGFLDAGKVSDDYYKVQHENGSAYVVSSEVLKRTCVKASEYNKYTIDVDSYGLCWTPKKLPLIFREGLWSMIKAWFRDIQYKIPYFG